MTTKNKSKALDLFISITLSILVIIFILAPNLAVIKESLVKDGSFTLEYYQKILENKTLVFNTFKVGILTTLLSALASSMVGLFYYLAPRKLKVFILIILSITFISPPFVSSLSYISLFGRRGLITYRLLGLSVYPYGMWGIISMQVLSDLSMNALLLIGFLDTLDRDVISSARSLGASTNKIILDIILPSMKNGLLSVMFLSFFRSVSDFGTPAIIGGRFSTLALESYFEVIAKGNLPQSAAMNVVILIPTLLLFFLFGKGVKTSSLATTVKKTEEVPLKRKGVLFYAMTVLATLLLLWIMTLYGSIILYAFTRMRQGSLVFTLENFGETSNALSGVVMRSIGYSLTSAVIGSLLGLLIGYYLIIRRLRFMKVIDAISNLPYIIPGTFFGLGYLLFFRSPPLMITGTSMIVILNVLFKQLPFSTRVQNAAMQDVDKNTLYSIRDLGGSSLSEIKDGILPTSKNAIFLSMINAFTTTMTTVGSIIFLVYPGRKLMTLVMFDVIQSGKYNVGSVIAFYIILICLAFNLLLRLLMRGPKAYFKKGSSDVFRN